MQKLCVPPLLHHLDAYFPKWQPWRTCLESRLESEQRSDGTWEMALNWKHSWFVASIEPSAQHQLKIKDLRKHPHLNSLNHAPRCAWCRHLDKSCLAWLCYPGLNTVRNNESATVVLLGCKYSGSSKNSWILIGSMIDSHLAPHQKNGHWP